MVRDHIVLAIVWILFCVFHSLFASDRIKKISGEVFKEKYYRLFYVLFAFASFGIACWIQIETNTILIYKLHISTLIVGSIVAMTGMSIMALCITKYFRQLSGLDALFIGKKSNKLMITGMHRFVRHPLYLGTFIFIWGFFIAFPFLTWLISSSIITAYTLYAIRFEEKKLLDEFGEAYSHYMANTPKILPRF